jgi:hypothetical protein
MAEETKDENADGGNKKKMVIVGLVLVLGVGTFVTMQLLGKDDDKEKKKVEEVDFSPDEKKPLLMIDLGEFTASMAPELAGNTYRKKIRLHPILYLKPYVDGATMQFNEEKNNLMMKRYEDTKSILITLILQVVHDMDPAEPYDSRSLQIKFKKKINDYDETAKEFRDKYGKIFGRRVIEVVFKSFEPR